MSDNFDLDLDDFSLDEETGYEGDFDRAMNAAMMGIDDAEELPFWETGHDGGYKMEQYRRELIENIDNPGWGLTEQLDEHWIANWDPTFDNKFGSKGGWPHPLCECINGFVVGPKPNLDVDFPKDIKVTIKAALELGQSVDATTWGYYNSAKTEYEKDHADDEVAVDAATKAHYNAAMTKHKKKQAVEES
jgi:hypothetical protein